MGLIIAPLDSTDELAYSTTQGFRILQTGDFFQQCGATTAIASTTTETSYLNVASTAQYQGITGNSLVPATTLPFFPGSSLTKCLYLNGQIVGTIANTGTPTLRTRVVLKNSAGTIVYTLADTTATAMTTVSTSDFEINFDCLVSSAGSAGSIISRVSHRYATTTVFALATAVTVDTTAGYYLDVLQTWGASSASNTVTIQWARMGAA